MIRILGKNASHLLERYYHGPDHPLKMRIWYGLWKAMGWPRLTLPYAGNGWITLDPRDFLQGNIFNCGSYELEVWQSFLRFLHGDEVFWDVGANIGSVAIRAGLDPRVRQVHAFEPHPAQGDVLTANVALNQGAYSVHRLALGDSRERRPLFDGLMTNQGLASLENSSGRPATADVLCARVDDLVFTEGLPAPTLLKIDVEGWESAVFRGANRLLRERPPKAIVFEWPCEPSGLVPDRSVFDQLRGAGYEIERIPRPSGVIEARENFLAFHPTPVAAPAASHRAGEPSVGRAAA